MKTLKIVLVAVLATVMLQACKKGENDPFLSLKTRDARITGTWELISSEEIDSYTSNYLYDNIDSAVYHIKETDILKDGSVISTYTETFTIADTNVMNYNEADTSVYSEQMTIKNLGVVEFTSETDYAVRESTDDWQWFDTDKRKTQIEIDGMVFRVDRLTNKELVLKYSGYENDIDKTYNEEWNEQYSIVRIYEKI